MSSVWVCRHSSIRTYFENIMQVEMTCMDKNGLCLNTGKPCDAIEYAPVVRGRWTGVIKAKTRQVATCSACKAVSTYRVITAYCPHCGAKMSEEGK